MVNGQKDKRKIEKIQGVKYSINVQFNFLYSCSFCFISVERPKRRMSQFADIQVRSNLLQLDNCCRLGLDSNYYLNMKVEYEHDEVEPSENEQLSLHANDVQQLFVVQALSKENRRKKIQG